MANYRKYLRLFENNAKAALSITAIFTAVFNFIYQYNDYVDFFIKHFKIPERFIDEFTWLLLFGPIIIVFAAIMFVLHFLTRIESGKKLNKSAEISHIDVYYKINYDTSETIVSRKFNYNATSKINGIFTIPPKSDGSISDLKYFEMRNGVETAIIHSTIPNKFGTEIYKLDVTIAEESSVNVIEKYKLQKGFKHDKLFDLVIENLNDEIDVCQIKVDIVSTKKISSAKWLIGNRNDDNNTDEGNIDLPHNANSYSFVKEFPKDKLRAGVSCAIKWIF